MTPALVVLAGGGARRFGADKTAAVVDGRTLLEHAVLAVEAPASVVVVGPERPLPHDVVWTLEEPAGSGPAAGLQAGLRVAPDGPALVLAADLPRARELAEALLSGWADAAAGRTRVVVDDDGRAQWTSVLLSADDARTLREAPTAVDAALHALLGPLDWQPVVVAPGATHDVDRPGDLPGSPTPTEEAP